MKNIKRFSVISLLTLFVLVFKSCDDDSELFTVSNSPTASVLADLNFSRLSLDPVNTNNPALTLNWQPADYGIQASVNYTIEFSSDDAFTAPAVAANVTGITSTTLSYAEVNTAAGNAGLNPFEWKPVYIRVVSSLGAQNGVKVTSNAVQVEVYPYFNYTFNDFYLVGDATAPGWNNNNNNPALFRDPMDSNVYYYTGRFSGGGYFKVLESKGAWHPQYGTDNGTDVWNTTASNTSPEPERFPTGGGAAITEGYYTFRLDQSTNTFTFDPYTVSTTSPASLELQGSSTANVTLTPLAFDGHIWFVNNVRLTPGEIEFVTGAGSRWGSSDSFSGVATDGGGAIPVMVEDDYDVWFNDLTGRYILIPLNL